MDRRAFITGTAVSESGLSFLGMGIQPPLPSWGSMLAEGRDYLSNAWWLATVPGLVIALVVLGVNLLGDAAGSSIRRSAGPRADPVDKAWGHA